MALHSYQTVLTMDPELMGPLSENVIRPEHWRLYSTNGIRAWQVINTYTFTADFDSSF